MHAKRMVSRIVKLALVLFILSGLAFAAVRAQGQESEQPPFISPQEVASFDNFGSAIAVSGDILVAGAPGTELEGVHNGGAAYVFQRQGKEWKEKVRLLPDPPQAGSGFGLAVAIDGKTVVVGARYEFNPGSGNGSGAVYVFVQKSSGWELQTRLAASDGAPFDLFGYAVAVHGDRLAVGARAADGPNGERNTGAVYLFQRNGEVWDLQARLSPNDLGPEDHFGQALALDDQYLFASAPGHDAPQAPNSGMIYGYHRQESNWAEDVRLAAEKPQAEAQLGSVLDLQGGMLLAMASQEYQKGEMPPSAPWYGGDFGAVHIFELQGGKWTWQTRLSPISQEQYGMRLKGVAFSGESGGGRLVMCSGGQGVVYRYQKKGQGWQELPALKGDITPILEGEVILLSGDQVLLGHRLYDLNDGPNSQGEPLSSAGVVFVLDW